MCLSRLWFPCVDSQSELCPWDITVTVPLNLVAVASGELTEQASGRREEGEEGGERGGRKEEGGGRGGWRERREEGEGRRERNRGGGEGVRGRK